ncbi:hypothetical protein [Burkholderia stagnalis]|uniref:hypothetical protein n=1 Tax=Burkholderia stagnalis TaxID=1503054 RepID=UPI0016395BF9|nr:hypothetical protein [Burkholderia stagnalis]
MSSASSPGTSSISAWFQYAGADWRSVKKRACTGVSGTGPGCAAASAHTAT